ncbi:MAG: hypothetical protein ABWZ40_10155 [Caulobacterales bacterium]
MGERKARLGEAVGVALTFMAGAQSAQAGAWPKQPGETEAIASFALKSYNHRAEKELDLYVEHGVRRRWTAVGGVRGWSRGDNDRTFAQIGLRRQMKAPAPFVMASETRLISGRDWNECGGWGLESRWLGGVRSKILNRDGFLDIEGAVRTFSDGCMEVRFEGSAGSVPERGKGFLLQANAEKIYGNVASNNPTMRVQAQASAIYGITSKTKLQFGARAGFEDSVLREKAVIVGIWREF